MFTLRDDEADRVMLRLHGRFELLRWVKGLRPCPKMPSISLPPMPTIRLPPLPRIMLPRLPPLPRVNITFDDE